MKYIVCIMLLTAALAEDEQLGARRKHMGDRNCFYALHVLPSRVSPLVENINSVLEGNDVNFNQLKQDWHKSWNAIKYVLEECDGQIYRLINQRCYQDLSGIASSAGSIGDDVVKIVEGDTEKIENVLKEAKNFMEFVSKSANDC